MSDPDATPDWPAILAETLADERLSRGERKAFRAALEAHPPGPAAREHIRQAAFRMADEAIDADNRQAILAWLADVTGLLARLPTAAPDREERPRFEAWFSPGPACVGAILGELRATRRRADVCVYTITDDRIRDGILSLHRRGLALRVLTDSEKARDLGSDVRALAREGVPVRLDPSAGHMHHKFAVLDGARLLTGSYNWTRAAARENAENVLVTDAQSVVEAYGAEFERLWGLGADFVQP